MPTLSITITMARLKRGNTLSAAFHKYDDMLGHEGTKTRSSIDPKHPARRGAAKRRAQGGQPANERLSGLAFLVVRSRAGHLDRSACVAGRPRRAQLRDFVSLWQKYVIAIAQESTMPAAARSDWRAAATSVGRRSPQCPTRTRSAEAGRRQSPASGSSFRWRPA